MLITCNRATYIETRENHSEQSESYKNWNREDKISNTGNSIINMYTVKPKNKLENVSIWKKKYGNLFNGGNF